MKSNYIEVIFYNLLIYIHIQLLTIFIDRKCNIHPTSKQLLWYAQKVIKSNIALLNNSLFVTLNKKVCRIDKPNLWNVVV